MHGIIIMCIRVQISWRIPSLSAGDPASPSGVFWIHFLKLLWKESSSRKHVTTRSTNLCLVKAKLSPKPVFCWRNARKWWPVEVEELDSSWSWEESFREEEQAGSRPSTKREARSNNRRNSTEIQKDLQDIRESLTLMHLLKWDSSEGGLKVVMKERQSSG